jgi:peptidoglycan/LPS O-acetylase OafA/YrhL
MQQETPKADRSIQPGVFGVFGIYRYFLATVVMAAHTGPIPLAFAATYAVRAFFVLSGYVVCYILRHDYLRFNRGILKYAANRALRILPAYLLTCALSLCLVYGARGRSLEIFDWFGRYTGPALAPAMALLVTMLPVSWSLATEAFYWAIMPTMLKSALARRGLIAFSLAYTTFVLSQGMFPPQSLYYLKLSYLGLPPSALPFCLGLLLFLHNEHNGRAVPYWLALASMALFPALIACAGRVLGNPLAAAAFVALGLSTVTIAWLSRMDANRLSRRLQGLDRLCGNLAYPVFLIHLPVAATLHILFPTLALHSWAFMALTLSVANPAALLVHCLVQAPVDRLRHRIKC